MHRRLLIAQLALAAASAAFGQTDGTSAVCAPCHRAIYDSYSSTPMARSARINNGGAIPERFDNATFEHSPSGFRYRSFVRDGKYFLTFENPAKNIRGEKALAYTVGSGTRAFSYLIAEGGFLFEAPVAYYARTQSWGLAPGYDHYSYPYLNRPIVPGCLSCHASSLRTQPATLNGYDTPPFLEGGVSCQRCHGDSAAHVARMLSGNVAGGTAILNPSKLPPAARDSICGQCHLTGDVRVIRSGANWQTFQPGALLSDSQTVFIRKSKSDAMTVTGHVENLALSLCKRKSGDRLWCGSCHDPHTVPSASEAASWYRSRCLECHSTSHPCAENESARAKVRDDCTACHMAKSPASDAQHVVLTDHSIPRRPRPATPLPAVSDGELVPFDGAKSSPRDLALAYAIAAVGKSSGPDRERAITLLKTAARVTPEDPEVLLSLAEIYRIDGKNDLARPLYQRVIALHPAEATASVGLGGVMMESGNYREAIRLWKDALTRNTGLELVRLNLSLALWKIGDRAAAEANLREALALNPAFTPARELLAQLSKAPLP